MANNIDAIVQAMRSDLGLGRVDDLELDNGQRGQGQRPGQHPPPAGRRPPANPKRPIAAANRWTAAIQQGEFDDDDAEMVKGLDRIGGGRLHALSSAPSFPPNQGRRPPGPPRPGGHGTATRRVTPAVQTPARPGKTHTQPPLPKKSHNVMPSQRPPPPAVTRPQPTSANEPPRGPRLQDPEPANYYYKVEVQVGDRLAKGKGVVYLVENKGTEADFLYVYLEGSVYLDYPLMSMFNYLTTDTRLCLQFREEDGVSITTTALDFGPQAKMVEFMQTVKTLTKAKRQSIAEAASSKARGATTSTAPSAAVPVPSTPVHAHSATPIPVTPIPAAPSSQAFIATTPTESVPEQAPSFAVMASDLVDLSQSTDTVEANRNTRMNRMSTYAMDLESLCSSPTQTGSETTTTDTENEADRFRFAPFQLPPAPTRKPNEKIDVFQVTTSAQQKTVQPAQKSTESLQGLIQAHLRTILPELTAMDELLSDFDEEDCLYILKTAVAQLQASRDSVNVGMCLPPASLLVKALAPPVDTSLENPTNGPRYPPDVIMRLRHQATVPPQLQTSLKIIPDLARDTDKTATAGKPEKDVPSHGQVAPPDERKESALRPSAEPFQPSPESKIKRQQSVLGSDKGANVAQPVLTSATTSAPVSGSDASSLQVKSTGLGPKGLKDSKWATPNPMESMLIFTGTKSHGARNAFNFTGGNAFI